MRPEAAQEINTVANETKTEYTARVRKEGAAQQAAALEAENARQARESFNWMTKMGTRYVNNSTNANLIAAYLTKHRLPWTEESLDTAFLALQAEEEFDPTPPQAPPPVVASVDSHTWQRPLTKKYIAGLTRDQYRSFYSNPDFRAEVNQLGKS
jgi:hypothetical protein